MAHTPETRVAPLMPLEISRGEWTTIVKRIKESKRSLPSDWHYGHYKATLDCPGIIGIHADMARIPFKHGFSPVRWELLIDMMLGKKRGRQKFTAFGSLC